MSTWFSQFFHNGRLLSATPMGGVMGHADENSDSGCSHRDCLQDEALPVDLWKF